MDSVNIDGVNLYPEKRIEKPKGDLFHVLKRSSPGFVAFGETYFSTVVFGATKGWKRHHRVTLNIVVPVGRMRFMVYDDRQGSATKGRFQEILLGLDEYSRLTVAPRLWVAFQGLGPNLNLLCNTIDEEHDPAEAENCDLEAIPVAWPD
ncbi:MAG: hypothetical protein M2R45_01811 [Verrucomicrobia subdivision 3 bacterium]|nr:hypothetical protein [Limisphaerales bacterium]MCS1415834.1 hypothetical protein [Limisphaerales bacterium]